MGPSEKAQIKSDYVESIKLIVELREKLSRCPSSYASQCALLDALTKTEHRKDDLAVALSVSDLLDISDMLTAKESA